MNYILIYDKNGTYNGFYNDMNVADSVLKSNSDLKYCFISNRIHDYVYNKLPYIKIKVIDVDDIMSEYIQNKNSDIEKPIIDSENYFTIIDPSIDMSIIKTEIIKNIKKFCGRSIVAGLFVKLSSGEEKLFSFKTEDQINLSEIVKHYSENDMIFYHANGEYDTLYSYKDILTIYKALYNNKLYNQIYTQILCQWIIDSYTEEMYRNKDVISYGYNNQDIQERVDKIYNEQKIL